MTHHPKRTRADSLRTTTCPSNFCYLLAIPKDVSVSLLLFLDVTELCLHCGISKYSNHLALSALELTKTACIEVGGHNSLDLIKVVGNRCTQLSYLTLDNEEIVISIGVTLVALRQALSRLPTVRVSVSPLKSLAEILLRLLSELNIQVEEISGGKGWSRFAPTLKRLNNCDSSDNKFLQQCRNLEALYFRPDDKENMCLAKCLKLRSLTLAGGFSVPRITIPHIPAITEFCCLYHHPRLDMIANSMPNLRHLFLSNSFDYEGAELPPLGSLKHLKSLRICIYDGLDKLVGYCAQLEVLILSGAYHHGFGVPTYDVLAAFEQLKVEDVDVCAWEWLYLIKCPGASIDAVRNLVRKLETVAPRLINVCVHEQYLKRSGELKLNAVSPWFGQSFKLLLRNIRNNSHR